MSDLDGLPVRMEERCASAMESSRVDLRMDDVGNALRRDKATAPMIAGNLAQNPPGTLDAKVARPKRFELLTPRFVVSLYLIPWHS